MGCVHEETNLGYVRRTIKPALGSTEVRKVRGPLLDNLYARLQKCGNLACSGRRLRLRLAGRWPWTAQSTAAATRLQALPSG